MDSEMQELKNLVRHAVEVSEDTNRIVHSMRRSVRWSNFFTLLYWLLILGALGASYFYVSPYITSAMQFYQKLQSASSQNQGQPQQLLQSVQNLLPHSQ